MSAVGVTIAPAGRPARIRTTARPTVRLGEAGTVFLASLGFFLAMVYLVACVLNIYVTDAMARTVHAWQVFFSGDPKLAAMGFIWPPLPTILQLPLVLLEPLRWRGLSGNLLTAVMAAGSAAILARALADLGLGRRTRLAMVALFCLNPMVLFYGANGMSEMTFVCFTLASVQQLIAWHRTRSLLPLLLSGMALGLALLARYDTIVHALLLLAVVPLLTREMGGRLAGQGFNLAIGALVPVAFTGGLWALLNALLMGDPLHFARGAYSNAAQIGYQMVMLESISRLAGNPLGVAAFLVIQTTLLFPAFSVGLAGLGAICLLTRSRLPLALGLLALSFPAFQAANLLAGQSAAFLRYLILAIPYGFLMIGLVVARVPARWRTAAALVGLVLLGLSNASSVAQMSRSTEWGQWNDIFIRALVTRQPEDTWREEREIGEYLRAHTTGREVLIDDFQAYRIIFFNGDPGRFIATSDRDYDEILRSPHGRARYILASPQHLEGALNRINHRFPTLYEHGASWATLERQWPLVGWRLYRLVERTTPTHSNHSNGNSRQGALDGTR